MGNWFRKSTKLLKSAPPETPQPFELTCVCGQRHNGLRRQTHQEVVCRACGTTLFILPKDVYPPPAAAAKPPAARSRNDGWEVMDDEQGRQSASPTRQGDPSGAASTADRTARPSRPKNRSQPEQASQASPSETPARSQAAVKSASGPQQAARRRVWTPLRLVMLLMSMVVVATLLITIRMQRLEDARRQLAAAIEGFQRAKVDQDWHLAWTHLNRASACLDILGRQDASAMRLRQYHRETSAMTSLANSSLMEILEEAEMVQARSHAAWQETFQSKHRGRWVVMELAVSRMRPPRGSARPVVVEDAEPVDPDSSPNTEPEADAEFYFEFPVRIGSAGRTVALDLAVPHLEQLPWESGRRSVVLAAQLADVALDDGLQEWTVSFNPHTAFLWVNVDTYLGLGFSFSPWNPRESVEHLLQQQGSAVGIDAQPGAESGGVPGDLAQRSGGREGS